MILTDTHAHLHFQDYEADLAEMLDRARAAGVRYLMNVGTNLECSGKAVAFAEKHQDVYAAAGCHPHDSKDYREEQWAQYRSLLKHPKALAIGEVGLDFFRNHSPRETQELVFRRFISLHKETGLPLILHIRDAHPETFRILEEELKPPIRGLLHCFSGDQAVTEKALELGLRFSFACNITYKKNQVLRDVLPRIPHDRIVVETDSPFLPPEGFRGKRNEPSYLVEGVSFIARILGLSVEEFSLLTTRNAAGFFGFSLS